MVNLKKSRLLLSLMMITLCVGCAMLLSACGKEDKQFTKTTIGNIVFETTERSAGTSLERINEQASYTDYKLMQKVDLTISITNTSAQDFNFQVGCFECGIYDEDDNGLFPFKFVSLTNTLDNRTITNKNESIAITAGTQLFVKVEFVYGEYSIRAASNEELKNEINRNTESLKQTINGRRTLELKYITNVIALTSVNMNYYSADTLINTL